MKNCRLLARVLTPLFIGLAFTASNGPGTGFALGAAVALAQWVAQPKPC